MEHSGRSKISSCALIGAAAAVAVVPPLPTGG